jgi:Uma2 family endonuclease
VTGPYDILEKLPDCQARGDPEVWCIHPHDRILTAWRRQSEGTYTETVYRQGIIRVASLPTVAFDLDALFEL